MSQAKPKRTQQLPPKQLHDGVAKVLREDTGHAQHAAEDDCLLTPEEIRDDTRGERRAEQADRRRSVQDLLVFGVDLADAIDFDAELFEEGVDGEQIANGAVLVAEVNWQKEDEEACLSVDAHIAG